MLRKRLTVDKINEKLKKIADPVKRFEKLLEVLKFLFVVFNKNKIDKELQKTMASWRKIQDDSTTLKLKLTLKEADPSIVGLLKKLHIVVISTSVNAREIVATVPVRRIMELTKLTAVERLSIEP